MPATMSPARARGTRLYQLTADVAAGARCAQTAPFGDRDWFRRPDESDTAWAQRSEALARACALCPVLAQCREVALRLDVDPNPDAVPPPDDDFVRGGMTAGQLAAMRHSRRHAESITRATRTDARHDEADFYQRTAAALRIIRGAATDGPRARAAYDQLMQARTERRAQRTPTARDLGYLGDTDDAEQGSVLLLKDTEDGAAA